MKLIGGASEALIGLLAPGGVLAGRTVTVLNNVSWPLIADRWIEEIESRGAIFVDRPLVRDGLRITADSASAALVGGIIEVIESQVP